MSDFYDAAEAADTAATISSIKGTAGGRFYVNERRELFGPVTGREGFVYFGHLEDSVWFHPPEGRLAVGMGSRLQRGKNYARRGQVISLEVAPGQVSAQVQGSRARPYRVRIGITAFDKGQWSQIEGALAENALFAAALLAGEMPADIEDVFDAVGLALFPGRARELSLDCSCPDGAVPCKHLAAMFYLLAQAFDDDPFAILAWRGRERDDLLENLAAARSGRPAADRAEPTGPELADCLDSFFVRQNDIPVSRPPVSASTALLDELPEVAVTVRGRGLAELLRPGYAGLGGDR